MGVSAVKHLGDRFRVSAGGNWTAQLSELRERSWVSVNGGASCQVLERMTVGSSVWDSQAVQWVRPAPRLARAQLRLVGRGRASAGPLD